MIKWLHSFQFIATAHTYTHTYAFYACICIVRTLFDGTSSVGGNYRLSIKCAINWIASHFITATHHFVSFNTRWRFTCALNGMINGLIDCKLLLVRVTVSVSVCVCVCARHVNAIYGIITLLALSNHYPSHPSLLQPVGSYSNKQHISPKFQELHSRRDKALPCQAPLHRAHNGSVCFCHSFTSRVGMNRIPLQCIPTELCDSYSGVTSSAIHL